MDSPSLLQFGQFVFDARTSELTKSGIRVRLQPQPAAVLTLLVQNAGELVTREEIQDTVWSDTIVEYDQALNFCIRQLRSVLGDDPSVPKYIETFRGRGYRFIAPVSPAKAGQQSSVPRVPARHVHVRNLAPVLLAGVLLGIALAAWLMIGSRADAGERALLAVLPFDTRDGDEREDRFRLGLDEAMTAELTSLDPDRLGVIGPAATGRYEDSEASVELMADELGVDHVLSGGLEMSGDSIRIYAQLIRVSDLTSLWAERYREPLVRSTELQRAIARRIAQEVALRILDAEPVAQEP